MLLRHHRYLALGSGMIRFRAGTLDELHQKILAANRRNGFWLTFEEIDTWTDLGRVVERAGWCVWEAAP